MADPEKVAEITETGEKPRFVVVSAPGIDDNHPEKITSLLLDYESSGDHTIISKVQARFSELALKLSLLQSDWSSDKIANDLGRWKSMGAPIAGLGEYWSAQLFADLTGRSFVDAGDIVRFDADGRLLEDETKLNLAGLPNDDYYVLPGFYGSDPNGVPYLFERGGSDISGALIAKLVSADYYENWSDVSGFYTADPRIIHDALPVESLTYNEARELGNGGTGLLHREAIRLLSATGIPTNMHNTFSPSVDPGTVITDSRDWEARPISGATARKDMVGLSVYRHGMREQVGGTANIFNQLRKEGIPFEHTATATDNINVYIRGEHKERVVRIAEHMRARDYSVDMYPVSMIHVVGEGLARSSDVRLRTLGGLATKYAEAFVRLVGVVDVSDSTAITFFVDPAKFNTAITIAHEVALESK